MTDEARLKALMLNGLAGDGGAHRALLSALSVYLRGYFGRRLGAGAADLEDLVQDTLLAVHTRRETYDTGQPFTPWVYAVARYKLIDHYRRAGVRKAVPLDEAADLWAAENPEEGAVRRDLSALLGALPERQRRLMRDVKLSGYSIEEAAARSGMTATAVKVSLHRSLKALAERVRNQGGLG